LKNTFKLLYKQNKKIYSKIGKKSQFYVILNNFSFAYFSYSAQSDWRDASNFVKFLIKVLILFLSVHEENWKFFCKKIEFFFFVGIVEGEMRYKKDVKIAVARGVNNLDIWL
jgi:hypothetical protein